MNVCGSTVLCADLPEPRVTLQAGQRTFRKSGSSYAPASIAVRAEAEGVDDPAFEWGHLKAGGFAPVLSWSGAEIAVLPSQAGVVMVRVTGSNLTGEVTDYVDISVVEDGRGVESVRTEYYLSDSRTSLSGGEWLAEMPALERGKYLWTRVVTTYTDGTEEATEPVLDPASVVDGQTRDDFAEKLGYGSWEEMVAAVAEHGSIIQGDYIRAELIDTNAIATDAAFIADLTGETAFINAISGTSFDFKQGKVGGFTIAANKLYAGADFGAGAGVRMQSLADDMGFKVYRNASNYVDMFYKDANNWGIRGVRNGAQYFALGLLEGADNNQIGGFSFDEARMKGSNLTLTGKMIHYEYDDGEGVNHVYIGSHSDMALGGATKLGTFVLGNYVFDALGANYYAPLNSNDSYALLCSCITTTHTAAGGYYAFYANGDALFKGMSFVRQFNISASSDKSITLGRSHTLVVITEGSGTITLQATEDLRRQSVYKNIAHFYTFINAGSGEPKLAGLAGGTGDARRVLWFRNQSCKVVMYYNGYFYGHTDYDG